MSDLLSGDSKAHQHGQLVLPFTALRRLECALESTKQSVVAQEMSWRGKVQNVDPILKRTAGPANLDYSRPTSTSPSSPSS